MHEVEGLLLQFVSRNHQEPSEVKPTPAALMMFVAYHAT